MSCTLACVVPTPAQAHCGVCHQTFGGVRLFDAHRAQGQCADPQGLGAEARNGVWRIPMTPEARQALVERFAATRARAEEEA